MEAELLAINVTLAAAAFWLAVRYGSWWVREAKRLLPLKLGWLPLGIAVLALIIGINFGFFGASRALEIAGIGTLRDLASAILLIQLAMWLGVTGVMIQLWRVIPCRIGVAGRLALWTAGWGTFWASLYVFFR